MRIECDNCREALEVDELERRSGDMERQEKELSTMVEKKYGMPFFIL